MQSTLASSLDAQASWRRTLDRSVGAFARLLSDHGLSEPGEGERLASLRRRLLADRLTVAFVAEFSRGKSELINAIFFADTGRRVLPATPGRTTMCPVELFHDADQPASLALLPIETRLQGLSLAELRGRDDPWERLPLDPSQPEALARALSAVTLTQRVSVETAERLGFWDASQPDENPPLEADGTVEVPAWRHALINYPHPLLQRGLVVIDTPGLNAIGAEPELTLALLPSADATVFVLAADTGVTKSDLAIWREHLRGNALERFVVLNKIDTLADPLLDPAEVSEQIERQCALTAGMLDIPRSRVFPLSAREALSARLSGHAEALERSRVPALEAALADQLLPHQTGLLAQAAAETMRQMREAGSRRLGDRRRLHAEQMLELRSLRGKSSGKVRLMIARVEAEAADFERCTARLAALRAVRQRQQQEALACLSLDTLRTLAAGMQAASGAATFAFGARKPFDLMFERLKAAVDTAESHTLEMQRMLEASFRQLNTEFGFSFVLGVTPDLAPYRAELDLIAQNYGRYLGLSQAWRLALPGFVEQFRRMLMSRLRGVFENAASEIELWARDAGTQVEQQLRERRKALKHRQEALERIQTAAGGLEQRIGEVEAQDLHLRDLQQRLDSLAADAIGTALGMGALPQANAA